MSGAAPQSVWRLGLWMFSAALAVSLHAGAIAVALRSADASQPVDDDAGVLMVELAPMAAAAPTAEQPLPPGPISTDAVDSAAAASQETEVKPSVETDQPPLPVIADPPPESVLPVQVSKPRTEEPEPERPLEAQPAVAASAASVASVAAAPPPTEAPLAEKPAALNPGSSQRDRHARTRWESALSGHLARFGRFPDGVRGLKEERIVTVRFRLDRNGRVTTTEVATSSGSEPLDFEALAMVQRASPLPVPPAQVSGDLVELVVPVRFKVRR